MGISSFLFPIEKLNADPRQQALAQAMLDSVENHKGFAQDPIIRKNPETGMRSKSRFMTLVLRETLENDIQNPCAIAVDVS